MPEEMPSDQQLRQIARRLAKFYVEVERGLRPLKQLEPYLTRPAYQRLRSDDAPHYPYDGPVVAEEIGHVTLAHQRNGTIHATVPTRETGQHWGSLLFQLRPTFEGRFAVAEIHRLRRTGLDQQAERQPREQPSLQDRIERVRGERALIDAAIGATKARLRDLSTQPTRDYATEQRLMHEAAAWERRQYERDRELRTLERQRRLPHRERSVVQRQAGPATEAPTSEGPRRPEADFTLGIG